MNKITEKPNEISFQKAQTSWKDKACLGGLALTLIGLIVATGLEWKQLAASYEENPLAWQIGLSLGGTTLVSISISIYLLLKRSSTPLEEANKHKAHEMPLAEASDPSNAITTLVKSSSKVPDAIASSSPTSLVLDEAKSQLRSFHYNCIVHMPSFEDRVRSFMGGFKEKSKNKISHIILKKPSDTEQPYQFSRESGNRLLIFYPVTGFRCCWKTAQGFITKCVGSNFEGTISFLIFLPSNSQAIQPDVESVADFFKDKNIQIINLSFDMHSDQITFKKEDRLNNQAVEYLMTSDNLTYKESAKVL